MNDVAVQLYERSLILRCQTGDEAALAELMTRYSAGLRLFLRKMTGNATVADDLFQDTWFDVYRKINRLQRPEAFAAWLYQIARNKVYSIFRKKPERHTSFDDQLVQSVAAPEEDFAPEDAEGVRVALDELQSEHREVLLLRFIEDMSYEEIAEVIGCSLGTVRSRIYYAKQRLRTKLRPDSKGRNRDERKRTG